MPSPHSIFKVHQLLYNRFGENADVSTELQHGKTIITAKYSTSVPNTNLKLLGNDLSHVVGLADMCMDPTTHSIVVTLN